MCLTLNGWIGEISSSFLEFDDGYFAHGHAQIYNSYLYNCMHVVSTKFPNQNAAVQRVGVALSVQVVLMDKEFEAGYQHQCVVMPGLMNHHDVVCWTHTCTHSGRILHFGCRWRSEEIFTPRPKIETRVSILQVTGWDPQPVWTLRRRIEPKILRSGISEILVPWNVIAKGTISR
jgi:hypothetical protein